MDIETRAMALALLGIDALTAFLLVKRISVRASALRRSTLPKK